MVCRRLPGRSGHQVISRLLVLVARHRDRLRRALDRRAFSAPEREGFGLRVVRDDDDLNIAANIIAARS